MDEDFELPLGWTTSTLGASAALVKVKVDPRTSPGVPYVGLEHIEAQTMQLLGHGRGSDVKSAKAKFSAGDVLYGKLRPYLNKVARPTFDGICSTDLLVFTESDQLDCGYLALYLNQGWLASEAHHLSNGVELPRIGWHTLSKLPIVYPTAKSEQRAVVAQIEDARHLNRSAGNHLSSASGVIARFRNSVLATACSGQLTAEWRVANDGIEIAEKAVARRRAAECTRLGAKYKEPSPPNLEMLPDLPDTWFWATLPELGEFGRGKSKHRPRNDPALYGGAYPFIQTGEVARSRGAIVSHTQSYNEVGLAQSRQWPTRTVCITIAANIADSALLTFPACFPDSVVGLIADESVALPEYVELFMRTARSDLAAFAPATAQANINLAILAELAIALPPVEEQREIIRRVEELYALSFTVELAVTTASALIDHSSQSVLAKAFRGELVSAV